LQSASTKLGPYVNDRIENRVVHSSVPINLAFYRDQTFFTLCQSSGLTLNIRWCDSARVTKINIYGVITLYSNRIIFDKA